MKSIPAFRQLCCAGLFSLVLGMAPGCGKAHKTVLAPPANLAPAPNSPVNLMRLFEWCWNNLDVARYGELFTDDFRFYFAVSDSAGNPYRTTPWTRTDELACFTNLIQGGSIHPPATRISLRLDPVLIPVQDSRPGKAYPWHQQISTTVRLEVVTDEGGFQITGSALFFLVRGDSALIPPDFVARGFRPDSTRWWIEQWQDETVPTGPGPLVAAHPAAAAPARDKAAHPMSWGAIKALYR